VVADAFSRRLSVILGVGMVGAGELLEGLVPTFAAVLLAQVIAGIGYTFLSGATQAWIADEVGEEHVGPVFLRGAQVGRIAGLVGLGLSIALATIQLNLPIVLGGLLTVALGGVLWVAMPETGFHPTPRGERTTWQTMGHTFRDGLRAVRGRPLLVTILVIELFFGMTSEGFDRLWEAHFLTNIGFPAFGQLQPVVWFGLINVGATLLTLAGTEILGRRIDTRRHNTVVKTLAIMTALTAVSMIAFGLAGNFVLALLAYWAARTFRSVAGPAYDAWQTQQIDPRVRATVLSMTSQANSFGQVAGGPVLGAVGNVSLRGAMALAGLLLAPTLLLFGRARGQAAPAETPAPAEA
jgi:DHA3 family tetracycline resistance protein-like MFS transporter